MIIYSIVPVASTAKPHIVSQTSTARLKQFPHLTGAVDRLSVCIDNSVGFTAKRLLKLLFIKKFLPRLLLVSPIAFTMISELYEPVKAAAWMT